MFFYNQHNGDVVLCDDWDKKELFEYVFIYDRLNINIKADKLSATSYSKVVRIIERGING